MWSVNSLGVAGASHMAFNLLSGREVLASSPPLKGRAIADDRAASTPSRFFSSSPLRGEDRTARFLYFTKIDLAVRGGGDFEALVTPRGDHPHLTTASLREAIVVLPPQGGGGENRRGGARFGVICDYPALKGEEEKKREFEPVGRGKWTANNLMRGLGLALLMLLPNAPHAHATTPPALELTWAQLVPPAPPKLKPFFSKPGTNSNVPGQPGAHVPGQIPGQPFDLGAVPNDGTPAPAPKEEGRWLSGASKAPSEPVPVVEALNGKRVQIGGYIVPLDFDATTVKEFLLVPFVGACVHVPPPPANQIIYVKSEKGIPAGKIFDPIYVTGTMTVSFTSTGLADTGYTISAEQVERK